MCLYILTGIVTKILYYCSLLKYILPQHPSLVLFAFITDSSIHVKPFYDFIYSHLLVQYSVNVFVDICLHVVKSSIAAHLVKIPSFSHKSPIISVKVQIYLFYVPYSSSISQS